MIEPVGFRVLIKPDPVLETTKSGIVLALDKKLEAGATQTGTVMALGPEAFKSYNRAAGFNQYVPWCTIGDHISFAKYAGKWVDDPDTKEEFLIINDEDVVAKFSKVKDDLATEAAPDHVQS